MKGGGGGSHNYSRQLSGAAGGNSGNGDEECLKLRIEANLKQLQSKIYTLVIGDILQLELDNEMQLVIASSDGILCGVVDAVKVIQLRACMIKGYKFKATILEINSTSCKVLIRNLQSVK
jgi:hypothetical protein